jgi:hypothetical protein
MPAKVGRRVSPPSWTITEHHEKPGAVLTRVQRHVADLFADQPRGDVSMDVSPRVALDRCHASTISKVPPVSNRRHAFRSSDKLG